MIDKTVLSRGSSQRIALMGDVHANLQALRAVLKDIDRRGITEIYNVGDLVAMAVLPTRL